MTAKKKMQPKVTTNQTVGIGIGITAAAVAAAGAFFLYGSKNAARNRKTVKSWTLKAKAEVLEKIEQAKNMTKEEYDQLIDTVSNLYQNAKNTSKVDLSTFKKEMKDHWQQIAKSAASGTKTVKKAPAIAKKIVKKATKAATTTVKKVTK